MGFTRRTPTRTLRITGPSTVKVFGLWSVRPTDDDQVDLHFAASPVCPR